MKAAAALRRATAGATRMRVDGPCRRWASGPLSGQRDGARWREWAAKGGTLAAAGAALAALALGQRREAEAEAEVRSLMQRDSNTKPIPKSKVPHVCSMQNQFVKGCSEVKVFAGNANPALAKEVAEALGSEVGRATVARFADGEVSVKIEESVRGKDVYIVQPTSPPVNETLVELLLMVSALRHASAKRVTVVVPYFGYMRSLSEWVSAKDRLDWNYARSNLAAKDVATMLEVAGAQRVVAVDMYPPGQGMAEGFFATTPIEQILSSDAVIKDLVRMLKLKEVAANEQGGLVVVAPHASCLTKAKMFRNELVKELGCTIGLATIIRTPPSPHADSQERKVDLVGSVAGKYALIVEDLIDTGRTTVSAVEAVQKAGATAVSVFASHPLLSSGAAERLAASPITTLVTLNTLPISDEKRKILTTLEVMSIAPTLADLISRMHFEQK